MDAWLINIILWTIIFLYYNFLVFIKKERDFLTIFFLVLSCVVLPFSLIMYFK